MKAADVVAGGERYLQHLVDTGVQEGLSLEFKGGRQFQNGSLARSSKESLAATLSSFANSAGGVLIFGVDCRTVDRIDCAQTLVPVDNLAAALTTMTDFVAEAMQPRHDGITVQAISSDSRSGAGYLVVDVPRSTRRPHMNQFLKTYHKRAGASKFQMEHYDVEDAFRRTTGPELALTYDIMSNEWPTREHDREFRFTLSIAAANEGSVTARHVCLRYLPSDNPFLRDHSTHGRQLPAEITDFRGARTYAFPSDVVIHPKSTRTLYNFYFTVFVNDGRLEGGGLNSEGRLRLVMTLYAEGAEPLMTVLEVPGIFIRQRCGLALV